MMETLVLVVRPAPQEVTSYLCYSCNFLCGRKEAELRSFFPYTKNYIHEVPDYLLLLQEGAKLRFTLPRPAETNILVHHGVTGTDLHVIIPRIQKIHSYNGDGIF